MSKTYRTPTTCDRLMAAHQMCMMIPVAILLLLGIFNALMGEWAQVVSQALVLTFLICQYIIVQEFLKKKGGQQ